MERRCHSCKTTSDCTHGVNVAQYVARELVLVLLLGVLALAIKSLSLMRYPALSRTVHKTTTNEREFRGRLYMTYVLDV